MKIMRQNNEESCIPSAIWNEQTHTLNIRLSSLKNVYVNVVVHDQNLNISFAAGWALHKGINEQTFDEVRLSNAGKLIVHIFNPDNTDSLYRSVLINH